MSKKIYKLPRRNNATDGKKAHNDNKDLIITRIRYNSWANSILKSCDIVVNETVLVHILNRHQKELAAIGMTAFDFVQFISTNFNEVWQGKGESLLLVVRRKNVSSWAAIELSKSDQTHVYKIKTASLIKDSQLIKKKLLCANVHR